MPYWNDKTEPSTYKGNKENDVRKDIKLLMYDIRNFIKVHPGLTPTQTVDEFCHKWVGYNKDYGEAKIEEIVLSGSWANVER